MKPALGSRTYPPGANETMERPHYSLNVDNSGAVRRQGELMRELDARPKNNPMTDSLFGLHPNRLRIQIAILGAGVLSFMTFLPSLQF